MIIAKYVELCLDYFFKEYGFKIGSYLISKFKFAQQITTASPQVFSSLDTVKTHHI